MRQSFARIACLAIALTPCFALAQATKPCPVGRTLQGTCASPAVTLGTQQRALVFTQPRISFLGPALPGSAGYFVDSSRDRQSLSYGIDKPVVTTPIATPAAGTFIGLPANINPANLNLAAPYTVVPGGIRIR